MGTDIHLFVETREADGWQLARVKSKCTWCDGDGKSRQGTACYGCKGTGQEVGYSCRSYCTFAMLADVRNGFGVAGVRTSDGFNVIAPQRGLPDDMSAELRGAAVDGSDELAEKYGEHNLGDHSHSWLTLRELLDFDWQQVTRHRGLVTLAEYRRWQKTIAIRPNEWCSGVWGHEIVVMREGDPRVTEAEVSDRLYVEAFWKEPYAESAGYFYSRFVPALVALGRNPADVRIVFGFDS